MFNGFSQPPRNLCVVLRLILMLEKEIRAAANLHRDFSCALSICRRQASVYFNCSLGEVIAFLT